MEHPSGEPANSSSQDRLDPALPLRMSLTNLSAQVKPSELKSAHPFRVLYLFAGEERRGDLREWLVHFCPQFNLDLQMTEVDFLRDKTTHDLVNA